MFKPCCMVAVACVTLSGTAVYAQTTWYVDAAVCPGPGSGTLADPFCSIQAGIDAADNGDSVEAASGTYRELINFQGKNITLSSSDGPEVTIINGDLDDNGTGDGTVVSCINNETPNTILDGFTITGGQASNGGGMVNNPGSPTVTNCIFRLNTADRGGGMFNEGTSSNPTVTSCTFELNTASNSGGGMRNNDSSPALIDCSFSNNSAPSGGGMSNGFSANPTVTNCTFSNNDADFDGGGMGNFDTASPTLTNCTFIDNISGFSGGGMFSSGGLTLTNCTFTQNSAIVRGGGMYIAFSSPMLANCTFKGNLAGSEGGGICSNGANPTLTNCMFSGNIAATNGGGMFNDNASPTLTNCTFSGNNAGINGGGMYNTVSSPEVTNCILWGNSPDQIFNFGAKPTVSYSDVEGGYAGAGNIDADPLFVDDASGDLHLSAGSPCIDAGNNFAVPFFITTDLDGNPRFVDDPATKDTGFGDPPIVDMGAYEFQIVAPCPWDLDGSGIVGILDLLALLAAWGTDPGGPPDFDGDGTVGILDLLTLLANWGPCV